VYQAYTGENFTFAEPKAALEKKGFEVVLWREKLPPVGDFAKTLDTCCQLWLLSGACLGGKAALPVVKNCNIFVLLQAPQSLCPKITSRWFLSLCRHANARR
jgi:hypothetical protein